MGIENETPVPREEILGAGAGGPLPQPGPWIIGAGYLQWPYSLIIGTPTGGAKGAGALNAQSLYIQGALVDLTKYLPFTGGTLTGVLTLAQDPANPFDAVDKRYVDNLVTTINGTFASYLPLTGGTLTGILTLHADPVNNLDAATKEYVDQRASGFTIPDAPSDGSTYGRNNATWTNVIDAGTY
jgi:hypothetical protein